MSGTPPQVVIVGGGIAGLATAYALHEQAAAAGLPVACTLLESDSYWGGKILTRRAGDLIIEAGPDSFLSQKPAALELCAKLGLSDRVINTNESKKGAFVFSRGRLRALPEGLVVIVPTKLGPFMRSGLVSLPGMARMALDVVLPAKPANEDESLASFFTRRLGREAFDRLIEPLMAGIYAGDAEQMSLRATFPRFLEIERQRGSLIRGLLAGRRNMQQSPRGGAPSRTMFVTLCDGLGELVQKLVERITASGANLLLGNRVSSLHAGQSSGGSSCYELTLDSGAVLHADRVVLATPAYVSAELVRRLSPMAADLLSRIPYASTATVSLAYERAAVASSVMGFGFVVPRVEGRHLIAATWSSRKWAHRAPETQVLVRCYMGGVGREDVLKNDDQTLVGIAREELRGLAGIAAAPEHAEVSRWIRGMPQYTLGHLERLGSIHHALQDQPRLYLTGAAYRGIGIPDCIKDGTETAAMIIRSFTEQGR